MITKDQVYNILKEVNDPEIGKPITELGMVDEIKIDGGKVAVKIKLTIPGCPLKARINDDVTSKVQELDGVENVEIIFGSMSDKERQELTKSLLSRYRGEDDKEEALELLQEL